MVLDKLFVKGTLELVQQGGLVQVVSVPTLAFILQLLRSCEKLIHRGQP